MEKEFKAAFKLTVPVMAGYVFLGIAFGVLAVTSGFPWWYPVLMSLIIYSGALEYAAVPMFLENNTLTGMFLMGLMISARHLFYGIPMLKKYSKSGVAGPFLIFGLTDETFSLLSVTSPPEGANETRFYTTVTILNYTYWNIGSILGALLSGGLGVNLEGLDFVLTALFVVLFTEQFKTKTGRKSAVIGLICSAAALVTAGSSNMVIVSVFLILTVLFLVRWKIEKEGE